MAFSHSAHSSMPFAGMRKTLKEAKEKDKAEDAEARSGSEAEEDGKDKAKKATNKRKRVKLDKEAIIGYLMDENKGIGTLYSQCKQMKFKGKGHEKHDLKMLMKKFEDWGTALVPALGFTDFIEKVESVGNTHMVSSAIDSYREITQAAKLRKINGEEPLPEAPTTAEVVPESGAVAVQGGGEKAQAAAPAAAAGGGGGDAEDDDDEMDMAEAAGLYDDQEEDEFEEDEGAAYVIDDDVPPPPVAPRAPSPQPPKLSAEVLERIENNKRMALEKLRARQAAEAKAREEAEAGPTAVGGHAEAGKEAEVRLTNVGAEEQEARQAEKVDEGGPTAVGAEEQEARQAEKADEDAAAADPSGSGSWDGAGEGGEEPVEESLDISASEVPEAAALKAAPVRRTFKKADRDVIRQQRVVQDDAKQPDETLPYHPPGGGGGDSACVQNETLPYEEPAEGGGAPLEGTMPYEDVDETVADGGAGPTVQSEEGASASADLIEEHQAPAQEDDDELVEDFLE